MSARRDGHDEDAALMASTRAAVDSLVRAALNCERCPGLDCEHAAAVLIDALTIAYRAGRVDAGEERDGRWFHTTTRMAVEALRALTPPSNHTGPPRAAGHVLADERDAVERERARARASIDDDADGGAP